MSASVFFLYVKGLVWHVSRRRCFSSKNELFCYTKQQNVVKHTFFFLSTMICFATFTCGPVAPTVRPNPEPEIPNFLKFRDERALL